MDKRLMRVAVEISLREWIMARLALEQEGFNFNLTSPAGWSSLVKSK